MKRRPRIGLTTYTERAQVLAWDTEFALLHSVYVEAMARAGGVPVLLPPQEHDAGEVIERMDALVLSGGSDVRTVEAVELPGRSSVRYHTPFGGFKQSGLCRELGPDAVDAFTETKNVFIAIEI